jgi:hypothetical protein
MGADALRCSGASALCLLIDMSHAAHCMAYSALVFGLGLVLVDRLGHLLYQDSGAAQSLGRSVVVPDEPANKHAPPPHD